MLGFFYILVNCARILGYLQLVWIPKQIRAILTIVSIAIPVCYIGYVSIPVILLLFITGLIALYIDFKDLENPDKF